MQIVYIAEIIERHIADASRDTRPGRFGFRGTPGSFLKVTAAQCYQSREARPQRRRWFPEELRHPPLSPMLPPSDCGAYQLAKFSDADPDCRLDLCGSIEDRIGALEIAAENQELGEQDARAEIGWVLAQGGIRRLDRWGELAGFEE